MSRGLTVSITTLMTCLILSATVAAREVQTLLEFEQGSATIESEYEASAVAAPDGSLVANAMLVERSMVELSVTDVSSPAQLPVVEPEKLDLRSVIQLAASSATYKGAWLWGNYVMIQSEYEANGRQIAWRSDYRCVTDSSCLMYTAPLPQLFEASFLLLKESGVKAGVMSSEPTDGTLKITARWDDPDSAIVVDQDSAQSAIRRSLKWHWQLPEIDAVLTRKQGNTWSLPVSPGNASDVTTLISYSLSRWLETPEILNTSAQYDSLRVYNYQVNDKQAMERVQLVEPSQLANYIGEWEQLLLIADVDFGDTGLIYVRPDTSTETNPQLVEEPVFVFQYLRTDRRLTLLPGILFDPRVELMSNIDFLEAMRRTLLSKG